MSVNLCIDWGNTQVKAGLFEAGVLTNSFTYPSYDALIRLVDLVEEYKPSYAILSSVSNKSTELESMLTAKVKKLIVMTDKTPLPIMNAYSSDTVGADRLAMAVGAYN
ncbi:MAG TPA: type III pantothenate kinase, partial [Flavipsychrobacter sp.]